jgi:hypothetical protein
MAAFIQSKPMGATTCPLSRPSVSRRGNRWLGFKVLEAVGFVLPALPPSLPVRLGILSAYLVAHFMGLQYRYGAWKMRVLNS